MRQALSRVILAACAAMLASCGGSGGGDASGGTPASPRTLALVAGTLDAGGSGSADGTGAEARFSAADLAMGSDGNLYVADNSAIRRVTPTGVVTTPFGRAGEPASIDGPSATARFWYPGKISAAADGSLYVLETGGAVAPLRRIAPDGTVTTVLRFPDASLPSSDHIGTLVIDGARRLYFIDRERCSLHRVDLASPALETLASFRKELSSACSIQPELRTDSAGNLYYVEGDLGLGTLAMKKRSATGTLTTVFGSPFDIKGFVVRPDGVVVFHDGTGVVYVAAPGDTPRRVSGARRTDGNRDLVDGDADTARFSSIDAMVADTANRVWTLEDGVVVRRVEVDGRVSTVAGRARQEDLYRPGTGEQARLGTSSAPTALVADAAGNAYFTGPSLNFRAVARVTPDGVLSTFVGSAEERGAQDGTGMNARFGVIRALARHPMGALLVAEPRETASCGRHGVDVRSVVRKVGSDGNVKTLPYVFDGGITGLAPLTGGSMLVTGDRAALTGNCAPAPKAVEVTEIGLETPLAAALPAGPMAGNGSGDTWFIKGGAIIKRFADGRLVLVAGSETELGDRDGVGAQARFSMAHGLDVDGAGNVYVADTGNSTVRKITPDGTVTTIVGRANQHGILLGALPGGLEHPTAVAVTPQGLLIRSRAALLRAGW